jgi:predicted RNA-binding Zn-ribbon protein involved in translation (DUF1610 family)
MARFMYGRNGADQLGLFTLGAYLVVWLVQLLTGWLALAVVEYLLLFVTLFRMLSRNLARRREENTKFLQATRPVQRRWTTLRSRLRDREHRYFKCPNCGQQMRVPRGKGRITVHCRNCGASFEEKS